MRIGGVLPCAGLVALAAACGGGDRSGAVPGESPVVITFTCSNGGALMGVHPWRVKLNDSTDHIKWTLNATNATSVTISHKDGSPWPFQDPPPTVGSKPASTRGVKAPNIPSGTYRYNVTGICKVGSTEDTVVLDPDMIIPY